MGFYFDTHYMKNMFKQYNYFYTQEEYKDIWENALFVFDTNTLLNLYRYQDYEDESYIDKILSKEEKMSKIINKYNFFRNTDLTRVDFSRKFKDNRPEWEQLESITREKRNLREKNNFYYNFSTLEKLSKLWYILVMCVLSEM